MSCSPHESARGGAAVSVTLAVALVLGILGAIAHAVYGHSWPDTSGHAVGSDDAYISYRYARNLALGHGLVFNPGERVEGYSNLLYVLMVAPAFWLAGAPVYAFSAVLNAGLLAVALGVFYRRSAAKLGRSKAAAGALILAANPFVWANAATGLETMLVLVSVVLVWALVEQQVESAGSASLALLLVAFALSILARIDGFLLPLLATTYLLLKRQYRAALVCLVFVTAAMAAYTAWRLYYYDDFIGNTFYAKVSGPLRLRLAAGLQYLADNAVRGALGAYFLVVAWALVRAARRSGQLLRRVDFALFYCVSWLGYLVYIGGDIYFERFLIGIFPLALYMLLQRLPPSRSGLAGLIGVAAVLIGLQAGPVLRDGRFEYRVDRYDGWATLGKFLGHHHSGALLAVDAAGKIPYFSGLPTLDMLGLNDKHIGKGESASGAFHVGHNKYDPYYVLSRRPALIASWIDPSLDLNWGLTKATMSLYGHGLRLRYLVNLTRVDKKTGNIVDVSALSSAEARALVSNGYRYAVMQSRPDESGQPGASRAAVHGALFAAADLPSQSGRLAAGARVAVAGVDRPGYVTYGPYVPLLRGTYRLTISYSGAAPKGAPVGMWDVFNADRQAALVDGVLPGTENAAGAVSVTFEVTDERPARHEFRTLWHGSFDLEVMQIRLERL